MRQDQQPTANRKAYSPAEFAALCGKHVTWAYRQLYAGRVKGVTGLGRILIPASEVDRVLGSPEAYDPKPRKVKPDATASAEVLA